VSFALDVNILLYASDAASPLHAKARQFIEDCAAGDEIVYLAWPTAGEDTDRELREEDDMSKVADSIRCGLGQAVAYAKGEADLRAYRVHVPPASAGAGSAGSTCARSAAGSA
jgi:predicted nucleic acid-binding protein